MAWDRWESFAAGGPATALMFIWAFAEAIFWPFIPEFLLVPLAVGNRRRFFFPLAASITGSALGGIALYLFAFAAPHQALSYLGHLPLKGYGAPIVERQFAQRGALAFLFQPLSGIPFKIWAIVGATIGVNPLRAIPLFIAVRSLRMIGFAVSARIIAGTFCAIFRNFSLAILAIYFVLFFSVWWRLLRA